MSEQWLSIVEYARAFNVSDMTVRRRIKNGKLKAELRDGKYYIPMTEPQGGREIAPDLRQGISERTLPTPRTNFRSPAEGFQPKVSSEVVEPARISVRDPESSVAVEAKSLMSLCERTLERLNQQERLIRSQYQSKIEACLAAIDSKDREIKKLKQDVEDLQLLVGMFEKQNR